MSGSPLDHILRCKPVAEFDEGEGDAAHPRLARSIGLFQLTMLGVGATIGTGIFVALTTAVPEAGPGVTVSFVLAGITAIDVRKVTNALRTLPVAPARGRFASIAVWVQGLPDEVDIFDLEIRLGGACAGVQSISPADSRDIRQIVAQMPELEQTGLLPVEAFWMGERMGKPGTLRVVPAPPEVPRLVSFTQHADGSISAGQVQPLGVRNTIIGHAGRLRLPRSRASAQIAWISAVAASSVAASC